MNGLYKYLEEKVPVERILISLAVGAAGFGIVLYSGLTSEYVSAAKVASRAISALGFCVLLTFIVQMSLEEYALYKIKRYLTKFIEDARITPVKAEISHDSTRVDETLDEI